MTDLARGRQDYLDAEEERELARAWQGRGCRRSLDRLVRAYLHLAERVAREWARPPLEAEDLVQEGRVGLVVAASRFDPDRGTRFGTYAVLWVRACVIPYVFRNLGPVRMGGKRAHGVVYYGAGRARRAIEGAGGVADPASLAGALGVPESDVREVLSWSAGKHLELDAPLPTHGTESGERRVRLDVFRSQSESSGEDAAHAALDVSRVSAAVERALADLPAREAGIVRSRYLREEPEMLEEVGRRLGVSRERVRQLEARALGRLRQRLAGLRE